MPQIKILLFFVLFLIFSAPKLAFASDCANTKTTVDANFNTIVTLTKVLGDKAIGEMTIKVEDTMQKAIATSTGGVATFTFDKIAPGSYQYALFVIQYPDGTKPNASVPICNGGDATINVPDNNQGGNVTQCSAFSGNTEIISDDPKGLITTKAHLTVNVKNLSVDSSYCAGVTDTGRIAHSIIQSGKCADSSNKNVSIQLDPLPAGKFQIMVGQNGVNNIVGCAIITTSEPVTNNTAPAIPTSVPPPGGAGELCYLFNGESVKDAATLNLAKASPQLFGIQTAIGCIPTEPTQFILAVSRLATGVGGGIALLLMIAGSFKMMTSAGNPDALKEGSEQISSAIIGLLFIIFAVLLLKVIGVDILNLPGFGSP